MRKLMWAAVVMTTLPIFVGTAQADVERNRIVNRPDQPVPIVVMNNPLQFEIVGGGGEMCEGPAGELFGLAVTLSGNSNNANLFTVPTGFRLLVTDLIVSGLRAEQQLLRNGAAVAYPSPGTTSNFVHAYSSPIEFLAGDQIGFWNKASGQATRLEIRGVLEALPVAP